MAVIQLHGGWGGSMWPPGETAVLLGVQASLAYDPDLKIFGHIITGDGLFHVRPYRELQKLHGDDEYKFIGGDGTIYYFERNLDTDMAQVWANWQSVPEQKDYNEFPANRLLPEYASDYLLPPEA